MQQIQDLTTVKNELTSEVRLPSRSIYCIYQHHHFYCVFFFMQIETLHASLEQERSKNKALKSELAKLQVGTQLYMFSIGCLGVQGRGWGRE